MELPYGKRQSGSASKLNTVRDGARILRMFLYLLKETRPLVFFGMPAAMITACAGLLAVPLLDTFLSTGTVPRMPTAVLCTGLVLLSSLLSSCGLILDSLARSRAEQKRILFLAVKSPRD